MGLHTYQYQGPDPDGLWEGPVDKEDAEEYLNSLLRNFKEYVEKYFESYLDEELKEALRSKLPVAYSVKGNLLHDLSQFILQTAL